MIRAIANTDRAPTTAPGPQIHDHLYDSFQLDKSAITRLVSFKKHQDTSVRMQLYAVYIKFQHSCLFVHGTSLNTNVP